LVFFWAAGKFAALERPRERHRCLFFKLIKQASFFNNKRRRLASWASCINSRPFFSTVCDAVDASRMLLFLKIYFRELFLRAFYLLFWLFRTFEILGLMFFGFSGLTTISILETIPKLSKTRKFKNISENSRAFYLFLRIIQHFRINFSHFCFDVKIRADPIIDDFS